MIRVSPSILAADILRLGEELDSVIGAGLLNVHVDIMDGRFVPNISYGVAMANAIRRYGQLRFDCHLMIEEPERQLADFVATGPELITVHQEATRHLHRVVHRIKELNVRVGVSLNPATPVSTLKDILPDLDTVLIMTVNPGFGGQKFIASTLNKISELRSFAASLNPTLEIQVDGGIDISTGRQCVEHGANHLVVGAAFFNSTSRHAFAAELKSL
ncbi:MAG: ribulose-phosphate 3-epimerase [Bacillota bacterium]|nr:MAG: ribulose-phosphate 3-epimerase [Bacillota bacterium]MBS3951063.1 ribulose-phosphate 3-epimerase [Peptococcaceae bacterium]